MQDLLNSPVDHVYQLLNPDGVIAHWVNTVYNVFYKHGLDQEVYVKNQENSPWITREVLEIMMKWDAVHINKDIITYCGLQDKIQYLICRMMKDHIKKLITYKTDSAGIWKVINMLTNKKQFLGSTTQHSSVT